MLSQHRFHIGVFSFALPSAFRHFFSNNLSAVIIAHCLACFASHFCNRLQELTYHKAFRLMPCFVPVISRHGRLRAAGNNFI